MSAEDYTTPSQKSGLEHPQWDYWIIQYVIGRATASAPKRTLPEPVRCCFPGCDELGVHTHHITYDPEEMRPLCEKHHDEITMLNMQQGRRVRHSMSNQDRWYIWYQWISGTKKVRRTRKSLEDLADWQSRFNNR